MRAERSPVRAGLVSAKHWSGTTNQLVGPVRAEACEKAACAAYRTTSLCLGSAGQPGISVWNDYGNVKWVSSLQGRTSSRNWDVCLTTPTLQWEQHKFFHLGLVLLWFYFLSPPPPQIEALLSFILCNTLVQIGWINNYLQLLGLWPKSWNKTINVIIFRAVIILSLICPPPVCRNTRV